MSMNTEPSKRRIIDRCGGLLPIVLFVLLTFTSAMQCVAQSRCPPDKAGHWTPQAGVYCLGERPR